jgi:hypothetical protein
MIVKMSEYQVIKAEVGYAIMLGDLAVYQGGSVGEVVDRWI